MIKYISILLFFIALPVQSEERTLGDNSLRAAALLAIAVDWRQTLWMADNYDKYYETNKILGQYPTKKQINGYFFGLAVTHYLFNRFGSKKLRFFVNTDILVTHGRAGWLNKKNGVKLGMKLNF